MCYSNHYELMGPHEEEYIQTVKWSTKGHALVCFTEQLNAGPDSLVESCAKLGVVSLTPGQAKYLVYGGVVGLFSSAFGLGPFGEHILSFW